MGVVVDGQRLTCVIACGVARTQAANIHQAVGKKADIQVFPDFVDVRNFLRTSAQPVHALIVGELDVRGDTPTTLVSYVAQMYPSIPILAFCRVGIEYSAAIRAVVRAGAHELVFIGRDDAGVALRVALESATRECASQAVLTHLLPILPVSLHAFAQMALTQPQAANTLGSLARSLCVNRKTLFKACAAKGLPAPSELLMWCRISLAAHLHSQTGRTIESIALELDFPSDTTLRNRIKSYTGLRATDLRSAGGAAFVARCLQQRIARPSARTVGGPRGDSTSDSAPRR